MQSDVKILWELEFELCVWVFNWECKNYIIIYIVFGQVGISEMENIVNYVSDDKCF